MSPPDSTAGMSPAAEVKEARYRVSHKTEYFYPESVPLCQNILRLRPRDSERQVCQRYELIISPAPTTRRDRVDFFGNNSSWVGVQEPHQSLRIRAESLVLVRAAPVSPNRASGPWDQVAGRLPLEARQYTYDSPLIKSGPELLEYARPSFAPGRPLLQCVVELTERIFKEFTFDSRATTVGTPILEVLQHRRGVCQDFAHLQVGCLRSMGLAARYVSGYLLTYPPPGQKRLVGADASHAWLSVFIPEIGWVDFDPTNGSLPSLEHITLGWARDYGDLSPVRGVIVGGHRHSMVVGVDVEPVNADGVALRGSSDGGDSRKADAPLAAEPVLSQSGSN